MFFKSELEDTKKHVEEKGQQKRKRPETGHVSRLCRFCQTVLTYTCVCVCVCHTHTHTHTCVVLTQAFLA